MDIRLKQLSYSSLLTLHNCPRKYQLSKLQAEQEDTDYDGSGNVTFAYGHIVGEGLQAVLQHKTWDTVLWEMYLGWHADLAASNDKQAKSFWRAVNAVEQFAAMVDNGFMSDWELYYHNGEPAVELSFIIEFPDGFYYRGFVDAVLKHRETGEVMVLECKTSSGSMIAPAQYKNSAQAIGYSIVLDSLFPNLSSYEVYYIIYKTKQREWETMPFKKSYLQRALWIRELLLDIDSIKAYEDAGVFPMHGESCYNFYRECEYLNTCTLSTAAMTDALTPDAEAKIHADNNERYKLKLSITDLIQSQLSKE